MKDVFAKLATDFLSTIVFLALYLITGNVVLATSVAIAWSPDHSRLVPCHSPQLCAVVGEFLCFSYSYSARRAVPVLVRARPGLFE